MCLKEICVKGRIRAWLSDYIMKGYRAASALEMVGGIEISELDTLSWWQRGANRMLLDEGVGGGRWHPSGVRERYV